MSYPPRLIFLYLQTGRPEQFLNEFQQEGWFALLPKLIGLGLISELVLVLDADEPKAITKIADKISYLQIHGVDTLDSFLLPNDILMYRNGFRGWYQFINRQNANGHWSCFYRAASNRGNWDWSIILEDIDPRIINGAFVDKDRLFLPFRKPVHPNIFYPIDNAEQEFDVCIGASHVHSKKGQLRTINACIVAQKILNRKLKCIMPGRTFKPSYMQLLLDTAEQGDLDVYTPGMVSRELLAGFYNSSKLYIHLATCGQNDRGVLEAMACGTPAMIGYPKFHPPYMSSDKRLTFIAENPDDADKTGEDIAEAYQTVIALGKIFRQRMRVWYLEQNGIREQSLPMMVKLFEFFKQCPNTDRPKLWEYYDTRQG